MLGKFSIVILLFINIGCNYGEPDPHSVVEEKINTFNKYERELSTIMVIRSPSYNCRDIQEYAVEKPNTPGRLILQVYPQIRILDNYTNRKDSIDSGKADLFAKMLKELDCWHITKTQLDCCLEKFRLVIVRDDTENFELIVRNKENWLRYDDQWLYRIIEN